MYFLGTLNYFACFCFAFFFPLLSSVNHSSASNYPAQESFNVSFASGFCAFSWQTAARGCGGEPGVPRWAQAPWLLKSIPRACELPAETLPALCPRFEVHRCLTSVKTFLLLKKKKINKKTTKQKPNNHRPREQDKSVSVFFCFSFPLKSFSSSSSFLTDRTLASSCVTGTSGSPCPACSPPSLLLLAVFLPGTSSDTQKTSPVPRPILQTHFSLNPQENSSCWDFCFLIVEILQLIAVLLIFHFELKIYSPHPPNQRGIKPKAALGAHSPQTEGAGRASRACASLA